MNIYENSLFQEDIQKVALKDLPWDRLRDKSLLISGATGLIGSFLVDVIMYRNMKKNMNCKIYALSRNVNKAQERFAEFLHDNLFKYVSYDINIPLNEDKFPKVSYALHLASNTHPVAYATDPIGTITTNIIGIKNMLDFCNKNAVERFLFASSNEIYGENRGDVELFSEDYCGYINCNTIRAGYSESKRCSEALCQAYIKQKDVDVVIARLTRSYGPTMLKSDTKAISQFINKAIQNENVVLKSEGMQYYSYTYVADAVSGLLTVLLKGNCGEAYNIADKSSDIRLCDLAKMIAGVCDRKVIFEIPDEVEKTGYSTATKARLNGNKLIKLGWCPDYSIEDGIKRTIEILKNSHEMQREIENDT